MGVLDRPQLADLFDQWERNVHNGLNVCMQGEVTRYHKGPPPSVDIQFGARPLLRSGERYDRPIISRVPIAQWSFGPIVIRAVPEPGDGCVCHVFDREIYTYLTGAGGTYDPRSRRTHDKNDIIAVPALRRDRRQPRNTDKPRTIYIGHESGTGTYMSIDVQTGSVSVVAATSVRLGSPTATLAVARATDPVSPNAIAAAWFATAATVMAKIPIPPTPAELAVLALFPTALTGLGFIASGSLKVKSE